MNLSGLLPVTTFFRCTMFGWRHCCSTLISRMDVTGMPACNPYSRRLWLCLCVPLQERANRH